MDAGARARELIYLASIASHSPLFTIDELDEEIRTADTLVESGETRSVRLGLVLGFASLLAAGEERGVRNAVERSREIAGHMRDAASAWVCDVHALLLDLGTVHQSRYEEAVQLLEDLPETGRDDDTFCALRDAAALRFAMAG